MTGVNNVRNVSFATAKDLELRWRQVCFSGRLVDGYRDSAFIAEIVMPQLLPFLRTGKRQYVADFGCGEGFVSRSMALQMEELRDVDPTFVGIDLFKRAETLKSFRERTAGFRVSAIPCSLLKLRFVPNSFDAAVFRFALGFFPRQKQPLVLQQIAATMKPGAGIVVWHDGGIDAKSGAAYNDIFTAGLSAVRNLPHDDIKATHAFLSYAELKEMAAVAGFAAGPATDLTDIAVGDLSPRLYEKEFNLSTRQTAELTAHFAKAKEQGLLPFRPESPTLRWPMYSCVLVKER